MSVGCVHARCLFSVYSPDVLAAAFPVGVRAGCVAHVGLPGERGLRGLKALARQRPLPGFSV